MISFVYVVSFVLTAMFKLNAMFLFLAVLFLLSLVTTLSKSQVLMRHFYPSPAMTNMEHVAQPRPGSHADKLWNRNSHEEDPDPLYSPASVPVHVVPIRAQKRSSLCRPMQPVK